MNRTSEFFIRLNWLITPLLDSRWHFVLSGYVALMRYRGRKSGRVFTKPVGYYRFGDEILISLTESRDRQWWRNYREPWPMALKIRGGWEEGFAVLVESGSPAYREGFERLFRRHRFIARIMKLDDYRPERGLTESQLEILLRNGSALVRFSRTEDALRKRGREAIVAGSGA